MPDFKAMYLKLFKSQTEAIHLLQKAQKATEEIFISSEDTELTLFPGKNDNDKEEGDKNK